MKTHTNKCFAKQDEAHKAGYQITYHVPLERWNETEFARTLDKAPEWDEHTSDDVLQRLKKL